MNTLRFETYSMPAADLGAENPLPHLGNHKELHLAESMDSAMPAEMLENMHYGHVPNLLPYTMQDGYNREKSPRDFRVAVLENDTLRATFLLEYGGRLWSLFHKPSGRELLSTNPVFQPANLALRNAWFSGGVEWNIGTIGHSPFTCSPVFAAKLQQPDGTPVLRLYEWERIRQVTYQLDAWLSDDAPVLFVRVSINNDHEHEVPMYWWSNMAVPETPDTRVLVPAETAYHYAYDDLKIIPVPVDHEQDNTYPTTIQHAADFFFHIPDERQPWIAALDGNGKGLFQVSTNLLKGRKLFVWGQGRGGRKWQEFLSEPGQAYLEIQAGLARTQFEHLRMPANTHWDWLEAYGLLETDAAVIHGTDWAQATAAASASIDRLVSRQMMEAELARSLAWRDHAPTEIIQRGSGWGALENIRRVIQGEAPLSSAGLAFYSNSLGPEQIPWLSLLNSKEFPMPTSDAQPMGMLVQSEWLTLLEKTSNLNDNWLAQLHLGLMKYYHGDRAGARRAWSTSLMLHPTAWALRNLAILDLQEDHLADAAGKYLNACRMKPDLLPLAVECGKFLVENGFSQRWLDLLEELSVDIRQKGRIRLLEARAALALGQLERAARLIETLPIIEDIREGELSLSQLWEEYQVQRLSILENTPIDHSLLARAREQFPLPERLDFRMSSTPPVIEANPC